MIFLKWDDFSYIYLVGLIKFIQLKNYITACKITIIYYNFKKFFRIFGYPTNIRRYSHIRRIIIAIGYIPTQINPTDIHFIRRFQTLSPMTFYKSGEY
jgi:hypothetical protein